MIRGIVFLAFILLITFPTSVVSARGDELLDLAHKLQSIHDRSMMGETKSDDEEAKIRKALGERIAALAGDNVKSDRSATAVTLYLINGGPPQVVRRWLSTVGDLGKYKDAITALLEYSEHRQVDADTLSRIDVKALPPLVGASIALARGAADSSQFDKARQSLSLARLLAPGTSIDEAALRREVALLLSLNSMDEALIAAANYLWRFDRSVFAPEVLAYFSEAVLSAIAPDALDRPAVNRFFDIIEPTTRKELLLKLTSGALLAGRLDAARSFSRKVSAIAKEPREKVRARTYELITDLLLGHGEIDPNKLEAVDKTLLSSTDAALVVAAVALARLIVSDPDSSGAPSEPGDFDSPALSAAHKIIAEVDDTLERLPWAP